MKFEFPDPVKLRNATLLIGVILLAISAAQIKIDLNEPVTFLGLPLIISERNLLTYALMGVSGYYLFRYWFYAMRQRSTWVVRASIFEKFSKNIEGDIYSLVVASERTISARYAEIDHCGIKYDELSSSHSTPKDAHREQWTIRIKNLRKNSWPAFLRDLDFVAPAVLNIAALGFALRNLLGG